MSATGHDTGFYLEYPDWGWKGIAALGVLMLAGGVIAFLNPFAASLTVEVVAGVAFLAVGLLQLWLAVTSGAKEARDRWLSGTLGMVLVLLAISLILNPMAGLVALTFVVAIIFATMGGLRVALALRERPGGSWGWIMASGVMSLALAVLIVAGLPAAAAGLLGIFLAVDLTMSGAMTLALAWHLYRKERG